MLDGASGFTVAGSEALAAAIGVVLGASAVPLARAAPAALVLVIATVVALVSALVLSMDAFATLWAGGALGALSSAAAAVVVVLIVVG